MPLLSNSSNVEPTTTTATTLSNSNSDGSKRQVVDDTSSARWEQFYLSKQDTFFQKRNYLHRVFPEIMQLSSNSLNNSIIAPSASSSTSTSSSSSSSSSSTSSTNVLVSNTTVDYSNSAVIMEVGCGTGSSLFSLASLREDCRIVGCDLSPCAVDLVKVFFKTAIWFVHISPLISTNKTKMLEKLSV